MMGSRGRYGKYGETKRFTRLRKAGPIRVHTRFRDKTPSPQYTPDTHRPEHRGAVHIKPAQKNDAEFIQNLSKRVFNQYGPYDKTLVRWYISGITTTVVATMDNRPVGFAMSGRSFQYDPTLRVYELLAIAVEPAVQKQGIGSLLLKEIKTKVKTLQAEKLVLHTAADNLPAQRLFKKHGFVISEARYGFYPEGQDALMMVRDLV